MRHLPVQCGYDAVSLKYRGWKAIIIIRWSQLVVQKEMQYTQTFKERSEKLLDGIAEFIDGCKVTIECLVAMLFFVQIAVLSTDLFLTSRWSSQTGFTILLAGYLLLLLLMSVAGTGFEIPKHAATALNMNPTAAPVMAAPQQQANVTPPIATQCFMLSNMFDPMK